MTAGIGRTQFSGNAATTTIVNELPPVTVGTIQVADSTNWPNGALGNFTAVIDLGAPTEEKVRCSGSSGTVGGTITVIANGRGYDGTIPVDHSAGAPIQHCLDATAMTDVEAHLYDNTLDYPGHQQYLTVGRHDIPGRHTFGGALTQGLVGDMATVTPTSTAVAGATGRVPDAGHTHPVGVPLVGDITTSNPGDTAAVGGSGHFADNAHRHAREAAAWTTYTPTWTGVGSNPALGNGTLYGEYKQVGKQLHLRITITYGSTTTSGTGGWVLSLPGGFTSSAGGANDILVCWGSPAGSQFTGIAVVNAGATSMAVYMATSSSVTTLVGPDATHPATWAAGNIFTVKGALSIQ